MSLIVTATQGGSVANGMALRVYVLNNAAAVQSGGTSNNQFAAATSFTQSVTTTQAGSRVYGVSAVFANNSATAAAATTLVDNIADAVNNARYVTFKAAALTGTPGPTTLGFTVASSAGPFAQAEILPATGTLTEDNSAPVVVSVTGAEVAATAAFNPPPGSLLVALVASHGGVGTETMTVSGGGLKWTELVKNDPAGGDYAGVWIAQVPSPASWTRASGRMMWSPGSPAQTFPLSITTTSLPAGTDGVPYSATVTATGGLPPYIWSVSAGTLPAWASLNTSTGAITGTPSGTSATTSFTIKVTDSNLNTASQAFSITTTGPPMVQMLSLVRAKLPLRPPLRGRIYSSAGTVKNPKPGPVFIQKPFPARAARPFPSRGRVYGISRGVLRNPQPGPVFRLAVQSVRAKLPPQPFLKGRISSNPGAPLKNPQPGPVFRQPVQVLRARTPLPARGRIGSNPGAVVPPAIIVPFRSATTPARIRPSLPLRGRISFNSGAPVRNPHAGTAFHQATQPARRRITLPPRGRIGFNPGGPVENPSPAITGLFNIVFPCAKLTGVVKFTLSGPAVSLSADVTRLVIVLPPLKVSLTATVLHQPLNLIIPKPSVSLTAINFNGKFAIKLPVVKVTLTGGHGHVGSFSIIFNVCSGMEGRLLPVRSLPLADDEDYPEFVDYGTGSPYVNWSAGGTPYVNWSAGSG